MASDLLGKAAQRREELILVVRATIGEGRLEVGPDELVRVEFGGVAGESLDVQAWTASQHCANVGAFVDRAAIQEQDDVRPEVSEQSAEKHRYFDVRDIVRMEVNVEAAPPASGTDRDGRDGRDLVAAIPMPQDRRLAARCPGSPDVGNEQEPGLVEEDEVGVQAPGFFLMAVHRYRFQCAMAASSRSTARRSGFWHDHPIRDSSRLTCAR